MVDPVGCVGVIRTVGEKSIGAIVFIAEEKPIRVALCKLMYSCNDLSGHRERSNVVSVESAPGQERKKEMSAFRVASWEKRKCTNRTSLHRIIGVLVRLYVLSKFKFAVLRVVDLLASD